MSFKLDTELVENIKSKKDPHDIVEHFDKLYGGTVYPSLKLCQVVFAAAAVEFLHCQLVEYLIQIGYPFSDASFTGVIFACKHGNKKLVEALINAGAPTDIVGYPSIYPTCEVGAPLDFVVKNDDVDLFRIIAPTFKPESHRLQRTVLHLVCRYGAMKCLEFHLKNDIYDINKRDANGITPIMLAIPHGLKLFSLLLEKKPDLHLKDNEKNSLLHWATRKSFYPRPHFVTKDLPILIEKMQDEGLDVNASTAGCENTLVFICMQITCLLKRDIQDPLPYSKEIQQKIILESLDALLKIGASVNGHPDCDTGPIEGVMEEIHSAMYFYPQGEDMDAKALDNLTFTLNFANKMLEKLFSYGANPNCKLLRRNCFPVQLLESIYEQVQLSQVVKLLRETLRLLLIHGSQKIMLNLPRHKIQASLVYEYIASVETNVMYMDQKEYIQQISGILNRVNGIVEQNLCSGEEKKILRELSDHFYGPRKLKDICRAAIYVCVYPKITQHVMLLPLPLNLKDFLLGKENSRANQSA